MYERVWRVFSSVMVRGACVSAAACTHLWSALASNTIMFVLTLRALVGPLRFLRSDGAVPFLPGNTFNDPNVSTPLLRHCHLQMIGQTASCCLTNHLQMAVPSSVHVVVAAW